MAFIDAGLEKKPIPGGGYSNREVAQEVIIWALVRERAREQAVRLKELKDIKITFALPDDSDFATMIEYLNRALAPHGYELVLPAQWKDLFWSYRAGMGYRDRPISRILKDTFRYYGLFPDNMVLLPDKKILIIPGRWPSNIPSTP